MRTDVLIIGAGLTGTVAADEIIRHSPLRVTQLCCGSGASPYIHAFCIPVGPEDSEALFYQDTIASGYSQSNPSLARALCYGTGTAERHAFSHAARCHKACTRAVADGSQCTAHFSCTILELPLL